MPRGFRSSAGLLAALFGFLFAVTPGCANPIYVHKDAGDDAGSPSMEKDAGDTDPDQDKPDSGKTPVDPHHMGMDAGASKDAGSGDGDSTHVDPGDGDAVSGDGDHAVDAGHDAGHAQTMDAGHDSGPEHTPDAGHDAGHDAGPVEPGPKPGTPATHVQGTVSFQPDFRKSDGIAISSAFGQIPPNTAPSGVSQLFVCAMDQDGEIDDGLFGGGDDDVLGCAAADRDGVFDITIAANGPDVGTELYLVTWFCDGADKVMSAHGGSQTYLDNANFCVRMNVPVDDAAGRHRKFLHSAMQELNFGSTNFLNWNLSCPNNAGSTAASLAYTCPPGDVEAALTEGDTNSATAWNKEFVHVFRAAAEAPKSQLPLKPIAKYMASVGCGPTGGDACHECTDPDCQDEVDVHITNALVADVTPPCDAAAQHNSSTGYSQVCIVNGQDGRTGTLNPFMPPHELGHVMLHRWMKHPASLDQGCTSSTSSWTQGNDEGRITAEAFANFVSVACWWNYGNSGMEYDGASAMAANAGSLKGSCGAGTACDCAEGELNGEGRATQFFVDLWDENSDDTIDITFYGILKVWSTFDQPEETDECGPDGRNLEDFRAHFLQLSTTYSWPVDAYDAAAKLNCVDKMRDGATECSGC